MWLHDLYQSGEAKACRCEDGCTVAVALTPSDLVAFSACIRGALGRSFGDWFLFLLVYTVEYEENILQLDICIILEN